MDKKRKLPARASARSSLSKKRTSTPPEPALPAPRPIIEEGLPNRIVAGKPLPTIEQLQPDDLPISQYQSVAESGVMAESLERSRKRWLSEGIFEKYWTKPSKKKTMTAEELANNPAKDSMTKLGSCTITIEPHIFEATMYAVKDPNPRQFHSAQQPMSRPIIQYGPPQGVIAQPPPPPTPPARNEIAQHGSSGLISQDNLANNSTPPSTNGHFHLQQSSNPGVPPQPAQHFPKSPANIPPSPATPSTVAPPAKSPDPVIQMLAERAATDQDLKALMRIVAEGKATPEQLKMFQAHIDELTKLLNSRQVATAPSPNPPNPNSVQPMPAPSSNARLPQPSPMANGRPEHHAQPQPQALRSKGPVPSTKPDISAVVFEFSGGSGDRYLFPKYSILEYLPGGQVIASFLIVRKGSSAESKKYDPTLDYYQPITIRLYTHQGRQLDSLAKVVASPDDVRKYMDDIMDNMTRAEYILLATRLSREVEQPRENEETSKHLEPSNNGVLWTASIHGVAAKQKPVKKTLTEQEQYRSYISSVS